MKKAIFIVGPTAVGKTALAVFIHKKIPSVLISADSIQVYRGADIISGKDHPTDTAIELIDILPPTKSFNVRDFKDRVVQLINQSDKAPIFVGGTGLYIKSLFEPIPTINIPPDKNLRDKLDKLSIKDLQQKLAELNPKRLEKFNNSDLNNPRRLVRAIEISMIDHTNNSGKPVLKDMEVLIIGLKTSMEDLRERIKIRVEERIKAGALEESTKLFKQYEDLSPQLKAANGYRQMFEFLQNKIGWDEAVEKWITADYRHAKAQMTYFKKLGNIHWFDIGDKGFKEKILNLISLSFPRRWESRK